MGNALVFKNFSISWWTLHFVSSQLSGAIAIFGVCLLFGSLANELVIAGFVGILLLIVQAILDPHAQKPTTIGFWGTLTTIALLFITVLLTHLVIVEVSLLVWELVSLALLYTVNEEIRGLIWAKSMRRTHF